MGKHWINTKRKLISVKQTELQWIKELAQKMKAVLIYNNKKTFNVAII